VLVTHDASLAARCDRTVHLKSGQIESLIGVEVQALP
jgi:predicted ABC-type transport system involved in lysophospholipase L1 biosynthesis ATPase subunit